MATRKTGRIAGIVILSANMNQPREENTSAPGRSAGSDRFSDDEQQEMRAGFSERLKIAFDGASNATIATRLSTNDATIHNYVEGKRLPVFEMLHEIARVTGVNLHWLITGKGERRVTKAVEMFSEDEEREIRELAARSGRSFDDEVKVLAIAAVEFVKSVE